ncbi:MAG TPA: MFS transporter [Gaiellales bacterium]
MRNVILTTADGRRFLFAQLMDSLGAGLSSVVLPWLVLDAGGSGAEAGAAFLVSTVPYVLLGLPAGDVGDRRPRRRVMEVGVACQLAAALVIPLTVVAGVQAHELPLVLIYAAGFGVTAGRVFVDAAAFGAIARLVGEGHFVEGQAALSFVWSLGFLIGPAIGGALIGLVGADDALWVQAAGFLLALVLIASMRVDLGPGDERPTGRTGLVSGLMLVARHPMLRVLTAVGMAWNLTVNMIYALLVVFARAELGAGGPETGWMLAVGGGAGLLGGLTAPAIHRRIGAANALRGGLLASAAGSVLLALSTNVWEGTVAFAAVEAAGLLFVTLLIGERQTVARPHEQARVGITGRMAALLASSLGALAASALVLHMRPSAVFAISAGGTVLVALAGQRLLGRI